MDKLYKLENLDRPDRMELKMTEFRASDIPHGFAPYILDDLAPSQQTKLNDLKIETVRQNQKYLARHPEIKAIVMLLLRHMFEKTTHFHIHRTIASYFSQPKNELEDTIAKYLIEMGDNSYHRRLQKQREKERKKTKKEASGNGRRDKRKQEKEDDKNNNELEDHDRKIAENVAKSVIEEILTKVVPSETKVEQDEPEENVTF